MKYAPTFEGKNKKLMAEYTRHLELKGIKTGTVYVKLWHVYSFLKFHDNKDAQKITKQDIEEYILHRRKNNKPKTVHNDTVDLRLFFHWLKPENDFFNEIKTKQPKNKLPVDELILPKDIKKLVHVCRTQRDRALLFLLWDSAGRLSEILNANISNVTFDQYGGVIFVNGKTGERRIRLIDSIPDLQAWINQHPLRDDPKAPLFVTLRKGKGENQFKRLDVRTVQNLFKTLAEDAGVKKNLHPHALRHGRLTELVKLGLKESELRIFAGWESDSKMPAVYLHISGEDVEGKILAAHGIIAREEKKERKEELKPVECPRCRVKNPVGSKYCNICSLVLDMATAIEMEKESNNLDGTLGAVMANSEFKEQLKKEIIAEMLKNLRT
jgi:integrase